MSLSSIDIKMYFKTRRITLDFALGTVTYGVQLPFSDTFLSPIPKFIIKIVCMSSLKVVFNFYRHQDVFQNS